MDEQDQTIIGGVSAEDVESFLADATERTATDRTSATDIYARWIAWHGGKTDEFRGTATPWYGYAGSQTAFGIILARMGLKKIRTRSGMVYIGLRIKEGK